MKPFFTLLIGKDIVSLEDKYAKSNYDKSKASEKLNFSNAVLYFKKANNPAMTVDIFKFNDGLDHYFFGFGTMVSQQYGILGNDFQELIPKIYSDNQDLKLNFVNGVYAGIEIKKNTIEIFNDFFGLSTLFYSDLGNQEYIISNSFEQVYKYCFKYSDCKWDYEALTEYLSLGKNISGNTAISSIKILLPSRVLSFDEKGMKSSVYRSFPVDSSKEISFNSLVNESLNEFKSSVKRMFNPKYKYCFSISGGTDSRLVYFEWPDREKLLTESYGSEDNSDIIKAKELVSLYGNMKLHEMEQDFAEKYVEGLFKYFDNIDYPLMAYDDNFYHLDWKESRKADIRFGGTDGELLGGENMYLSRKPLYVIKEGFFSYPYLKLNKSDKKTKEELISNILYRNYKSKLVNLMSDGTKSSHFFDSITEKWDTYLGECNSQEVFVERYRTWHTVVDHNYHFQNFYMDSASQMTPFQDYNFTKLIAATHPKHRELRKLEIAVLNKYNLGKDIAIDTTHLKVGKPYFMHKFFRMIRFAMNIGYSMKVPFVQKGSPLKTTIPTFYNKKNQDFRIKVLEKVKNIEVLDKNKLHEFIAPFNDLGKYNHFNATHDGWPNLFILLKLAEFEERLKKLQKELV